MVGSRFDLLANLESTKDFPRNNRTEYVQRFIMKLRKIATPEGGISAEEMERARTRWINYLQDKHYLQVISGKATIKKEIFKSQLNPRLNTDGIVR